jgi:class 3 adenylate cyclase
MGSEEDIGRVIENRVRGQGAASGGPRPARDALQRLFSLFGRGKEHEGRAEDVLALLSLLGVDEGVGDELTHGFEDAEELGLEVSDVLPIIQAYARAIARMVEAEAGLVRQLVGQRAEDERAAYLDRILVAFLPWGMRGFEVLHATMLDAALRDELAPEQLVEQAFAPVFVSLVDLCGSTRYLASADEEAAGELVDALFEAGQTCVLDRHVRVMKYVGDGIFLVGRDAVEVAEASFAAMDQIDARLDLDSRAGIASGRALRRAGDHFGLPVNLAQLLTKVAPPRTVLATDDAVRELPPDWHGPRRPVEIRGWSDPLEVVTLKRGGSARSQSSAP